MQNAKAMADSFVAGKCKNAKAEVAVRALTDATYTNTAGCEQGDSSSGNASGDTSGSTGEAVCESVLPLAIDLVACCSPFRVGGLILDGFWPVVLSDFMLIPNDCSDCLPLPFLRLLLLHV